MKESSVLKNISEKFGIASINKMQQLMSEKYSIKNIMLLSATGSGKTIAFAIPLIKNLNAPSGRTQAVVIAPSRELALQIGKVIQAIATDFKVTCCYGGHKFEDEKNSLSIAPDILIGTPGRILDHLKRGNIDLRANRILVIDEFDKSLELGFQEEMRKIIRRMPNVSRRILTSATQIEELPDFLGMDNIATFNFLETASPAERMDVYEVKSDFKDKLESLLTLLKNLDNGRTIVFSNHRESAERIFDFLAGKKLPVGIYHGGLDQIEREKAISMFNNGSFMILSTTDLGSRGLDIADVKHIVHYHIPTTEETYTHRNGRTARVDASGSIYVITGPEEKLPDFIKFDGVFKLDNNAELKIKNSYSTLFFAAGKKEKISKGDIVGFLVSKSGLEASEIGKIDIADHYALAAVPANKINDILKTVAKEKIKNKKVRISIAKQ